MATAAIIATIGSTVTGVAARNAEKKASKRAAQLDRRAAAIQAQKNARKAIQQQRLQQALLAQAQEGQGARANSAIAGGIGSIGAQTAGNIGQASTRLAAQIGQSLALERGADKSAGFLAAGDIFSGIASIGLGVNQFQQASRLNKLYQQSINKANSPIGIPFFLRRPGT